MSTVAVRDVIGQIKRLSSEDRQLFDTLLAKMEEDEWSQQAIEVRQQAREQGIDQEAIDRAVARVRYAS